MNRHGAGLQRVLIALPIFFALLCHAIAWDRWALAVPSAIGLAFAVLRSADRSTSSRQWYIVIGVGLIVGLVVPAADVSAGPLPPAAAAALTAVAIAVALFAVYTGRTTVAWSASWALVTIVGKLEFSGPLRLALLAFLLSSLIAAAWQTRLIQKRHSQWLTLGLFVATLVVSTSVVAALIQRVDQVFLNSMENFVSNNGPRATTGIGNSISLNAKSTITPSSEALLELSELTGVLRVNVMDEFDGVQWSTSSKLNARIDPESLARAQRDIELVFLDEFKNSIPSPAGATVIGNAKSDFSGGWILLGNDHGVSVSLGSDDAEQLPAEPVDEIDYLSVPEELRLGLGPLAKELTNDAASNLQTAELVSAFFQDNFQYSLTTDLSGQAHPLVMLVEGRRPAYCVYFASAMAVMLRTQGIPTRIVTGYVPGEVNPVSGKVTIRGRDAHAWVEAWSTQENRFVAFDPTPSSSRRQLMGHDESAHFVTALLGAVRSAFRRIWLLFRHQPTQGMVTLLMSPLFWIGIGLLVAFLVKRRFTRTTRLVPTQMDKVDPKMKAIYDLYVSSLRKAGITPLDSETDDELLARIAALHDPLLLESVRSFLERYRVARFRNQSLGTGADLEALAQLTPAAMKTQ